MRKTVVRKALVIVVSTIAVAPAYAVEPVPLESMPPLEPIPVEPLPSGGLSSVGAIEEGAMVAQPGQGWTSVAQQGATRLGTEGVVVAPEAAIVGEAGAFAGSAAGGALLFFGADSVADWYIDHRKEISARTSAWVDGQITWLWDKITGDVPTDEDAIDDPGVTDSYRDPVNVDPQGDPVENHSEPTGDRPTTGERAELAWGNGDNDRSGQDELTEAQIDRALEILAEEGRGNLIPTDEILRDVLRRHDLLPIEQYPIDDRDAQNAVRDRRTVVDDRGLPITLIQAPMESGWQGDYTTSKPPDRRQPVGNDPDLDPFAQVELSPELRDLAIDIFSRSNSGTTIPTDETLWQVLVDHGYVGPDSDSGGIDDLDYAGESGSSEVNAYGDADVFGAGPIGIGAVNVSGPQVDGALPPFTDVPAYAIDLAGGSAQLGSRTRSREELLGLVENLRARWEGQDLTDDEVRQVLSDEGVSLRDIEDVFKRLPMDDPFWPVIGSGWHYADAYTRQQYWNLVISGQATDEAVDRLVHIAAETTSPNLWHWLHAVDPAAYDRNYSKFYDAGGHLRPESEWPPL